MGGPGRPLAVLRLNRYRVLVLCLPVEGRNQDVELGGDEPLVDIELRHGIGLRAVHGRRLNPEAGRAL